MWEVGSGQLTGPAWAAWCMEAPSSVCSIPKVDPILYSFLPYLFQMQLCCSFHKGVECISSPLEFVLTSWLTLASRRQQKWFVLPQSLGFKRSCPLPLCWNSAQPPREKASKLLEDDTCDFVIAPPPLCPIAPCQTWVMPEHRSQLFPSPNTRNSARAAKSSAKICRAWPRLNDSPTDLIALWAISSDCCHRPLNCVWFVTQQKLTDKARMEQGNE